jgi:hypothetical protein
VLTTISSVMLWLRLEYQVWDQLDPDENFGDLDDILDFGASELEADSGSGDLNQGKSFVKSDISEIHGFATRWCFVVVAAIRLLIDVIYRSFYKYIGHQKVITGTSRAHATHGIMKCPNGARAVVREGVQGG